MQLKIRHKLLLLIFIPICLTFALILFTFYSHFEDHFKDHALEQTQRDIELFTKRIQSLKKTVTEYTQSLAGDEALLTSMNLIVNYEDPSKYYKLIFDKEKRKLLEQSEAFLSDYHRYHLLFFSPEKKLIAYKDAQKGADRRIISSYDATMQPVYLDQNGEPVSPAQDIPLQLDDSGRVFLPHKQTLYIQIRQKLQHTDGRLLGYVKVLLPINREHFQILTNSIPNDFWIKTRYFTLSKSQKPLNVQFTQLLTSEAPAGETPSHLIYFKRLCKKSDKVPMVFAVSGFSKNKLFGQLKGMVYQGGLIVTGAFLLHILLVSFFTGRYILQPLNDLLGSIKGLRGKEFHPIDIKSSDELGQISTEFNQLSLELQSSVLSLERSNLLLQNILDTVPIRIFIKDRKGHYIKANKQFLTDTGYTDEEEIIGKSDFELPWSEEEAKHFIKDDQAVVKDGRSFYRIEESQTRRDGSVATLLTSKVPLKNAEGEIIGLLGMYDDITAQKNLKSKLMEKEKYLLHQSRLAQMGEMISMIAHQWRQPLTAISSTANSMSLKLAMDNFDKEYFNRRLENITKYSQHLSETIDDFRNFFKKHKDKKEITLEKVVEDSLNIIQTSLQNREITVYKDFNCFKTFKTYPNELRQVVLNLIKNAEDILIEQEMEEKWIKIQTEFKNGKHLLLVSDNAGGIDETIMDKIFEPYFSTKQNRDGTGLGLYMSKIIIEEHCHGKLSVSNDRHGAVFKVEL